MRNAPHQKAPSAPGRTLVAVDVENVLATADPAEQDVVQIHRHLTHMLRPNDQTLFEVASSHHAARAVMFGFPTGRFQMRSGADGADTLLLEALRPHLTSGRFDDVVICSGDGIFAPIAAAFADAGMTCTVVSLRASLSASLKLAASAVLFLDDKILDDEAIEGTQNDAA